SRPCRIRPAASPARRQARRASGPPARWRCPCPAALLAALDVPHQAALLRDLALGQRVLRLVLVRVVAFLEDEPHRRADELEALAEEVLEIPAIAVRQRAQARAMHDERRRVLAARVREA